ncbi:hypothetical protein D3C85_850360 [compost metagenome]
MNHQHGVGRNDHPVRATYSDTGRAGRQGIDAAGTTFTQATQRVVNRQPIEQVTADAVECNNHRGDTVIHGAQILHKLIGRNAPIADLAIDKHFNDLIGAFGASLHHVPGFVLHGHALASPVVNHG